MRLNTMDSIQEAGNVDKYCQANMGNGNMLSRMLLFDCPCDLAVGCKVDQAHFPICDYGEEVLLLDDRLL